MALTITVDDVKQAASYLPAEKKLAMAELMVGLILEKQERNDGQSFAAPPVWRENRMKKQQFLMGVLATQYFGKSTELQVLRYRGDDGEIKDKPVPMFMSVDALNEWAGSHVMNQLERLKKKHGEISDKLFDLLYDFRAFEQMLNGAIRDELEARNDPIDRISQVLTQQVSEEALRALKEQIAESTHTIAEALPGKNETEGKHG